METNIQKSTEAKVEQVNTTPATVKSILSMQNYKKRFEEILGKKAQGFISSVLNTANTPGLAKAEPYSVVFSAVVAATLDLPIDKNLGFSAIVPYYDNKSGKTHGQFQMMYKGYIQLAQRSGQYKSINACEIYEGEIESINRITGDIVFKPENKKSDNVVGYAAYFRLINGFEKTLYMTKEEVDKHAKRYSASYKKKYGNWIDDFDKMATKTVLKLLLSKYGILSIDMQQAIKFDQSVISKADETTGEITEFEYVDNDNVQISDDNKEPAKPIETINPLADKGKRNKKEEPAKEEKVSVTEQPKGAEPNHDKEVNQEEPKEMFDKDGQKLW